MEWESEHRLHARRRKVLYSEELEAERITQERTRQTTAAEGNRAQINLERKGVNFEEKLLKRMTGAPALGRGY